MIVNSPKSFVKKFFDNTAESYDKIVHLTTFGKDVYWKEEIINKIPNCNSILDLACGTGVLTFKIAKRFPDVDITGVDITRRYLDVAKNKLKPCHKILFFLCDAEKLNLDKKFDCITSSYIPKYCNPSILIERCLYHLNSEGKIVLHDFTYPSYKIIRLLWNFYFTILRVIGFFTPRWKPVFKNLPHLIRSTNWVKEYKDVMEKKGLDVEVLYLTCGTSAILTGTKEV